MRAVIIGSLGLAGTAVSHTVLGFVTTLAFVTWIIVQMLVAVFRNRFSFVTVGGYIFMLGLGLGLSAFFWLPSISEMGFTNVAGQIGPTANFRDHFVCLSQLWNSPWGFGGSAAGCVDGLSFMIGKIYIIGTVLALGTSFFLKKQKREVRMLVWIGSGIAAVFSILTLRVSHLFWEIIPGFAFVQYPWRFLSYVGLGTALASSSLTTFFKGKLRVIALCALVIAIITTQTKRFSPQYLYDRFPSQFESKEELRWRVSKISDEYLPPGMLIPQKASEVLRDTISESSTLRLTHARETDIWSEYRIKGTQVQSVTLRKTYFPGWRYWIDGSEATPTVDRGLPTFIVSEGVHTIVARFTNTPVRWIGNALTVVSVGCLVYLYGTKRKKTIA